MLELRALCKSWHQPPGGTPRTLLAQVSLHVAAGSVVALLGASGSGKSTLLKIIAGIEAPDAGQVLFDGDDLTHAPPEKRRCGLIFQDFALFPHLTVAGNVAFGLIEQGLRRSQAHARACEMLVRFGLGHCIHARVSRLSGGEQQRVALARALVVEPRVLLLDEPFSALDFDLRVHLRAEFTQQLAELGTAALWVTHDEAEARAVGQRGYRLVDAGLQPLW